jgi:hypothetical protein
MSHKSSRTWRETEGKNKEKRVKAVRARRETRRFSETRQSKRVKGY